MRTVSLLIRLALACAVAPAWVFGAAFIKFDGVDGEAQDRDHRGWSDLESFSQAMRRTQPAAGGGRLGTVVFEDIACVKTLDKASPKLAEAVAKGKVFPKAEIHLTTQFGDERVVYYAYELRNVLLTSYQVGGSADAVPSEQLSLNFEEIKVTYTEYDAAGRKKGNVEYSWKVEEGKN